MPELPEGWELDYNGSRWMYRFKASGLTQFQFPKPGDEFPEFVGAEGVFDMAPEDCLASDRQVKRQSMQEAPTEPAATQQKKKSLEDINELDAAGYFDTDSFMYLGPGSFYDPVGGQQTGIKHQAKHSDVEHQHTSSSARQRGTEAKATLGGQSIPDDSAKGGFGTAQGPHAQVVGDASKESRPREGKAIPDTMPNRQSPVGFIAELASHETQNRPNNMSNVELGVSGWSISGGPDVQLLSGPVELPAHRKPTENKQPRRQEAIAAPAQPADCYPLVSASFAFPPLPPKQPIDPSKTASCSGSAMRPQKPPSRAMAGSPSTHEARVTEGSEPPYKANRNENRFSTMPEIPTLPSLTRLNPQGPKRHSIQGPGPVAAPPSRHSMISMPPSDSNRLTSSGAVASQQHRTTSPAPRVPPKIPLDQNDIKADNLLNNRVGIPGSKARHESISSNTSREFTSSLRSSGLTQCPSVLRPGYYRSSAIGPPQQSHRYSVSAMPDRQQPHQQHLPHVLSIGYSHSPHDAVAPKAPLKPQWHTGHASGESVVRMPDARDFAVRPTATTRTASEPTRFPSPMTVSSPKSPPNGPGLVVFHEIGPKRGSGPDPATNSAREISTKEIHELGDNSPLPVELPSDQVPDTKLDQTLPFIAPLRLSPSPSRRQVGRPLSMAITAQELAATPPAQRAQMPSTPSPSNSARADADTCSRLSGTTAGAGGTRQHSPADTDTVPPEPVSRSALPRSVEGVNGAISCDAHSSRNATPGPQAPSPLTRPASLAQSQVSSPTASNASLYQVPISTPTPGPGPREAPNTQSSAAESSKTAHFSASKQTPKQAQQAIDNPPTVAKTSGNSVWTTSSINYSGEEWGQNWFEECPGIVPEDYKPI